MEVHEACTIQDNANRDESVAVADEVYVHPWRVLYVSSVKRGEATQMREMRQVGTPGPADGSAHQRYKHLLGAWSDRR